MKSFFIFALIFSFAFGTNQSTNPIPKVTAPNGQHQGAQDTETLENGPDSNIEPMDFDSVIKNWIRLLEESLQIPTLTDDNKKLVEKIIPNSIRNCQRAKAVYEKIDPNRNNLAIFLASQTNDIDLKCEVESKLFEPILISHNPKEPILVYLESISKSLSDYAARLLKRNNCLIMEAERVQEVTKIYTECC
jgi:hypothetical protein